MAAARLLARHRHELRREFAYTSLAQRPRLLARRRRSRLRPRARVARQRRLRLAKGFESRGEGALLEFLPQLAGALISRGACETPQMWLPVVSDNIAAQTANRVEWGLAAFEETLERWRRLTRKGAWSEERQRRGWVRRRPEVRGIQGPVKDVD
jgi:hypothetical protein